MAHVFTLSVTAHRVPRWLSEGLSVLEEWTTGPTPGVNVEPPVLDAFMEDKFLPIARLDEGFLHPSYENQVQVSYAQAGLACLYMEQRFGFAKVQQFLLAFREDPTTAETVRKVLGVTPEDFDAGFNAFMRQRFAPYIADSKSWLEQLRASHAAVEEKNWSAARTAAQEAIRILPEYTGSNSGYEALAAAEEGAGNAGPAITALMNWRKAGGWDPAGLRKLGALLLAANRDKEATEVLTAVNWADPLALGGHGELGELLLASRDGAAARREYEVLLALAPLDTATAHFGLARAYRELGDTAKSRRHLLQALETAPNYRPAQKMLLEMTGEARP
jgi:tetratricopeptide (TPR) repeat protein